MERDVLPFLNECGGISTTVQGHSYTKFDTQKEKKDLQHLTKAFASNNPMSY